MQHSKTWLYHYLGPLFEFRCMWIFPSDKISRHYCSYKRQTWICQTLFWQFRMRSYLLLIWFCDSYACSCSLYEGRTSFFMELIPRKLWSSEVWFLMLFSSNIDVVLLINPSAIVFVFGVFNMCHKDWLTYLGGTETASELYYNFSS